MTAGKRDRRRSRQPNIPHSTARLSGVMTQDPDPSCASASSGTPCNGITVISKPASRKYFAVALSTCRGTDVRVSQKIRCKICHCIRPSIIRQNRTNLSSPREKSKVATSGEPTRPVLSGPGSWTHASFRRCQDNTRLNCRPFDRSSWLGLLWQRYRAPRNVKQGREVLSRCCRRRTSTVAASKAPIGLPPKLDRDIEISLPAW